MAYVIITSAEMPHRAAVCGADMSSICCHFRAMPDCSLLTAPSSISTSSYMAPAQQWRRAGISGWRLANRATTAWTVP